MKVEFPVPPVIPTASSPCQKDCYPMMASRSLTIFNLTHFYTIIHYTVLPTHNENHHSMKRLMYVTVVETTNI
jgi:hypothetical protein